MRFLLAACSVLVVVQPIAGWGDFGHRTVAYLAERYLTDDAAALVSSLLANENGYDISDGAIWADRQKMKHPETAQWHYIDARDNPPQTCGVNYKRDCSQKGKPGCVISAITDTTAALISGESLGWIGEKEALMFLLHFLGDVHQPLHVEDASRGGNEIPVCFDRRCSKNNLHAIWDTDILLKHRNVERHETVAAEKASAAAWAEDLYNAQTGVSVADCTDVQTAQTCALFWATEANAYICSYVLDKGADWLEKNDLGGSYYDGAAPIVDAQIGRAGVRLAAWLNAITAARAGGRRGASGPLLKVQPAQAEL